jgi:hypothetical protein
VPRAGSHTSSPSGARPNVAVCSHEPPQRAAGARRGAGARGRGGAGARGRGTGGRAAQSMAGVARGRKRYERICAPLVC